MWDCDKCGCKSVAASLEYCPMCFIDRNYVVKPPPAAKAAKAAKGE